MISEICNEVLRDIPDLIDKKTFHFILGKAIKLSKGQIPPSLIKQVLSERLSYIDPIKTKKEPVPKIKYEGLLGMANSKESIWFFEFRGERIEFSIWDAIDGLIEIPVYIRNYLKSNVIIRSN